MSEALPYSIPCRRSDFFRPHGMGERSHIYLQVNVTVVVVFRALHDYLFARTQIVTVAYTLLTSTSCFQGLA